MEHLPAGREAEAGQWGAHSACSKGLRAAALRRSLAVERGWWPPAHERRIRTRGFRQGGERDHRKARAEVWVAATKAFRQFRRETTCRHGPARNIRAERPQRR